MKLALVLAIITALGSALTSPMAAFATQTVVGGNCGRHGMWRGSSDCPG